MKRQTINEFAVRLALAGAFLAIFVAPATSQGTVRLDPDTVKGFDQFIASSEESMAGRRTGESGFLWLRGEASRLDTALGGRVVVAQLDDLILRAAVRMRQVRLADFVQRSVNLHRPLCLRIRIVRRSPNIAVRSLSGI